MSINKSAEFNRKNAAVGGDFERNNKWTDYKIAQFKLNINMSNFIVWFPSKRLLKMKKLARGLHNLERTSLG